MQKTTHLWVVLCLAFLIGRCEAQSVYIDTDGNLVVDSHGGAVTVWIWGEDITGNCAAPYCNNELLQGTDGLEYKLLLGYGAGVNQWIFFNLEGQEGVDLDHAIIATDVGDAEFYCSRAWAEIFYGIGTGIPDFELQCVPEPVLAPMWLICALAIWRRRYC